MKKIFLFFAVALFCANMSADQSVTVNFSGNTTQGHFPVYGDNADSKGHKVQAIYLADQLKAISVGSEIKSLTFYSSKQSQSWGRAEFRVSLAKTDNSYFKNASGEWASASSGSILTQVYNGPLSVADGELTINFASPYAYEGGNLLIQVEVSTAGSYVASSFYSANSDYMIKYASSGSSREQKQPKVTLVIAGGDDPVSDKCNAPTAVKVESVTDATATITWEGEAALYQYCVEFEGNQPDWANAKLSDKNSVTLSGLYDEQKYYLYVRTYCSETEVSETVKVAFKTACARLNVPWIETFTRDASGSETVGDITPECWIISSANPAVTIVSEKEDDGNGNQIATGQQYLNARGGATSVQVFAMPLFNAQLDTLEVAFDYRTSLTTEGCGLLEVGYMTNPSKADTFVSLKTLPRTLEYAHTVVTLETVPQEAQFIAFRFAGGTSDLCSVSLDNFVVAGIGKSGEVDPSQEILPDAEVYAVSYCQAQFTWYSYSASAFAIGLFNVDSEALVAGIVATTEECDRFAYEDQQSGEFGGFPDGDDHENHYYCSTKWILNADEGGIQKGDAWASSVINVGSMLGLAPGQYQVQVYELIQTGESSYEKGELLATITFEIVAKKVSNLQAEVAEDRKTATLTWDVPELASGERLYVRVWAGETVAYDNFNSSDRPESPLTVNVLEGKSYTAIVQVIDRNLNPQGPEVETNFTVGVNPLEPKNPTAVVEGGDNVTFSWDADEQADAYVITLYLDGEFYTTLNVQSTSKTTTTPADGTWSWTVQAFNIGENDNYYEASIVVAGNDFDTKSAEIPEDAIELQVYDFNAFIIDQNSKYAQDLPEGKTGWVLIFRSDDEGYAGYPIVWFLIYTTQERAISGVYNTTRGNIDLESTLLIPNVDAAPADYIFATDAEMRLQFDGYDDEKYESGYVLAYYTGSFRLVGNNGKTYVARFMEQFCYSGNYDDYEAGNASYEGMFDEDPGYFQSIEEVVAAAMNGKKFIKNGQLFIVRDGKVFNAQGILVK